MNNRQTVNSGAACSIVSDYYKCLEILAKVSVHFYISIVEDVNLNKYFDLVRVRLREKEIISIEKSIQTNVVVGYERRGEVYKFCI